MSTKKDLLEKGFFKVKIKTFLGLWYILLGARSLLMSALYDGQMSSGEEEQRAKRVKTTQAQTTAKPLHFPSIPGLVHRPIHFLGKGHSLPIPSILEGSEETYFQRSNKV